MVVLATALGESEELRQRGRQGTVAQHGCSSLLWDQGGWTSRFERQASPIRHQITAALKCKNHVVIAVVIGTLKCFFRSRHTNNIGNQLQLCLMTRSALVERLQQHGMRVNSCGSPTWVFPPTFALTLLWLWCTSFLSPAYLRKEDDIFKLAKVAVVVNLDLFF